MKAYSVDLREKIFAAVDRGMIKAQAARTLGVGATSVKRYVKLQEEGKPLTPGTLELSIAYRTCRYAYSA